MKIIFTCLLVQFVIIGWSARAHRRRLARVLIEKRLARLHWTNGHPDPFDVATEIDAILWENGMEPREFGIDSLEALYALVEPAEKRYAERQRRKTSQK